MMQWYKQIPRKRRTELNLNLRQKRKNALDKIPEMKCL